MTTQVTCKGGEANVIHNGIRYDSACTVSTLFSLAVDRAISYEEFRFFRTSNPDGTWSAERLQAAIDAAFGGAPLAPLDELGNEPGDSDIEDSGQTAVRCATFKPSGAGIQQVQYLTWYSTFCTL